MRLPSYGGNFVLDLGNGKVLRVQGLAGCVQPRFTAPPLDCKMEILGQPDPALLGWIGSSVKPGPGQIRTVTLIQIDSNAKRLVNLELQAAFIKRVELPTLEGSEKQDTGLVLTLVSDRLVRTPGNGSIVTPVKPPAPLSMSLFTVSLNGVKAPLISTVNDLAIDVAVVPASGRTPRTPGVPSVPPFELAAAPTDIVLRGWADEALFGKPQRDMTIDLLSLDLKETLLRWTVLRAQPLGEASPFAEGGDFESDGRVVLSAQGTGAVLSTP